VHLKITWPVDPTPATSVSTGHGTAILISGHADGRGDAPAHLGADSHAILSLEGLMC
jgi:hypothetical protein